MSIDTGYFHIGCPAHGCPAPATLDSEIGRCCRYHYGQAAHNWPAITAAVRDNYWLAKLITDVTDLVNKPRPNLSWSFYVHSIGLADDDLLPSPDESVYPPAYLERLHLEMLWRVGARRNRPEPWSRSAVHQRNVDKGLKVKTPTPAAAT